MFSFYRTDQSEASILSCDILPANHSPCLVSIELSVDQDDWIDDLFEICGWQESCGQVCSILNLFPVADCHWLDLIELNVIQVFKDCMKLPENSNPAPGRGWCRREISLRDTSCSIFYVGPLWCWSLFFVLLTWCFVSTSSSVPWMFPWTWAPCGWWPHQVCLPSWGTHEEWWSPDLLGHTHRLSLLLGTNWRTAWPPWSEASELIWGQWLLAAGGGQ